MVTTKQAVAVQCVFLGAKAPLGLEAEVVGSWLERKC